MVFTPNTVASQVSKYMGNAVMVSNIWGSVIINVKASPYFAKGDGTTDDTVAIQAAINAARTSGGRIYFPPGTYYISDTLLYDSYQFFEGASKGSTRIVQYGGGIACFKPRTQDTAATFQTYFKNLKINNVFSGARPMDVGSIGFDLREASQCGIMYCSLRYHQNAIRLGDDVVGVTGGFYNSVIDCEIASNDTGIYMGTSSNAIVVQGGRINGNEIGMYVGASGGNRIDTTFESNADGIIFANGARNHIVTGYFEGNAKYITGLLDPPEGASNGDYAPGHGAIVFQAGAINNVVLPSKLSNTTDVVLDFDGRNINMSLGNSNSPGTKFGNGKNLLSNPIMDRDSNADGLADGWKNALGTIPAGTTVALDTGVYQSGTKSQRMTLAAAGTSNRAFRQDIKGLTIGLPHVFTFVVKTDFDLGFNMRIGNSTADSVYANVPIRDLGDEWQTISTYFIPTQSNVTLYVFQQPSAYAAKANDANIWIDRLKVESGLFSTSISDDPQLSGFDAYRSTNQSISSATFTRVVFDTENFDNGSEFDGATGRFTAIDDGYYSFSAALELASLADGTRITVAFYKNGTEYRRFHDAPLGAALISTASGSLINVKLRAGDYIEVWVLTPIASTVNAGDKFSYFSGVKIG